MRFSFMAILIASLLMAGCGGDDAKKPGGAPPAADMAPGNAPGAGGPPGNTAPGAAVEMKIPTDLKPVAIDAGVASITTDNSKIEFIGTHVGAKPDPRLGGFEKISGKADVDVATKTLKAVSIEIDTKSIWTALPPLTNHLKSPDFFDVNEHPSATFKSTEIKAMDAAEDKYTVTGDLTLHGVTKSLSLPVTVKINDAGLTLISQFSIDRTDFGMTFGPDKVEKSVSLAFVIGDKTQPK